MSPLQLRPRSFCDYVVIRNVVSTEPFTLRRNIQEKVGGKAAG